MAHLEARKPEQAGSHSQRKKMLTQLAANLSLCPHLLLDSTPTRPTFTETQEPPGDAAVAQPSILNHSQPCRLITTMSERFLYT
ncbi:hypothetical protein Pcinc_041857 [Petrolisthes cinctipes]|uniref:Uncharacterized protein n=1 Tax=Petrolisthes cinctipes TaxID=88211 RepID=A0AAE1BMF6_PETCI|nr:hypothetical protein Pcinc_041857 [Petrolisthes cinctipes]